MVKRIEEMESVLKVLKNEIKATLTDIREHLLTNVQNPFPLETARDVPRPGGKRSAATPGLEEAIAGMMRQQPSPSVAAEGGPSVTVAPGGNGGNGGAPAQGLDAVMAALKGDDTMERIAMPKATETPGQKLVAEIGPAPQEHEDSDDGDGAGKTVPQAKQEHRHKGNGKGKAEAIESSDEGELEEVAAVESQGQAVVSGAVAGTDLVTLAMLISWLEDGMRRIGRKRLKVVVEVYSSMGGLSCQLKDVLLQFMGLDGGSYGAPGKVPLRECLRVMADLDNLMMRSRLDRSGAALLSLLLNSGAQYADKD
ncbi:MAG: hypothetical protein V1724_01135 [Chloroflexota bacterium]